MLRVNKGADRKLPTPTTLLDTPARPPSVSVMAAPSPHYTPCQCILGTQSSKGTQGSFITHGEFHACGGRGDWRCCEARQTLISTYCPVLRPDPARRGLIKWRKTASVSLMITGLEVFKEVSQLVYFEWTESFFPLQSTQLFAFRCPVSSLSIHNIHANLRRLIGLSPCLCWLVRWGLVLRGGSDGVIFEYLR